MKYSEGKEASSSQQVGTHITRRLFNTALAYLGVGVVANEAAGGPTEGALAGIVFHDMDKKIDNAAIQIAQNVEKEMPHASALEKAKKTIDYLGTFLFGLGIRSLMPGGKGHIDEAKYGALAALTLIKYQLEDENGKHHLLTETKSNARAFVVINGTIAIAEGLQFDAEKTYENLKGKAPEDKDKIALMTSLASCLSPITTTVGSASVLRKMSSSFSALHRTRVKDEDDDGLINTDMANVFVSHVSNLSGFLLFGDPPFIAVCEKYGFAKGLEWQMETMWPLGLYSLLSSTIKLNYQSLKIKGYEGNITAKALADGISGIMRNVPLIASIMARSFLNTARYFTPAGAVFPGQDPNGIEVKIGEVLVDKIQKLAKLPFDPNLDKLTLETFEGMTRDHHLKKEGAKDYLQGLLAELSPVSTESVPDPVGEEKDLQAVLLELHKAIEQENWDKLAELEEKVSNLGVFTKVLRDFLDNEKIDHSTEVGIHETTAEKVKQMWSRTFDVTRVGNALGHNMRDVVNVFPFQAGCVPFLVTAFKDGVDFLNKKEVSPKKQEIMIFFAIMAFSSIADNYVACKIGLELFPDKPHIPLIGSIVGGSLSALGNMANVAQFNLQQYPFATSIVKDYWQLDTVAASLIWKETLDWLNKIGVWVPPTPIEQKSPQVEATPDEVKKTTRKGLFDIVRSGLA